MRLTINFTYWSLMLLTLILSCFLFCVVASENEKYITTEPVTDASMASAAQQTAQISNTPTTNKPTSEQSAAEDDAPAAGDGNVVREKALNGHNNDIILPNYKKVKKLPAEEEPNMLAPQTVEHVSSPSVGKSDKTSDTSDEIIQNPSDSVLSDFDNINGNSAENKNVFNTIATTNREDTNEKNTTQSSIEQSTEQNLPQQVPDVEQPDEQGFVKQQHAQADNKADKAITDLPDITDIPTVTVTELPLEILQQPQNTLDSVIIDDGGEKSKEESVNRTIEVIAENQETQNDEQIVKINDSGGGADGGVTIQPTVTSPSSVVDDQEVVSSANNIPTDPSSLSTTQSTSINASVVQQQIQQQNDSSATSASQVNLTAVEEVPMPVFSEWAQKQMEAAEKQQALEQEQTVNNSAQRKNHTNGNGKPTALKIRAKNYASPDCGAKIIASSAYTSNAGAVLSSSKDEYMLSLCGNRIWFVVELCEAIQAQTIDFANFELYSSSPQNFTVAVSKRFPTREWSNVGRFEAEDKRAIQSFDLHPHLFGKFVRVDINSHYSKEHFCTLSLFRVFGTSEFEAFETENHPNEDLDDFDDDYLLEQNTVKHAESNLFKSASDAVLSIVKKATEALGKPANNQNQTFKTQPQSVVCRTPIYGLFSCTDCPTPLVDKVNNLLTCEFSQLNLLLNNKNVRNDLLNTRVCAKHFGIETNQLVTLEKDIRKSFYVSVLPNEFVGALCQLLAKPQTIIQKPKNSFASDEEPQKNEATELPTNLTIDKKFGKEDLNLLDHPEKKLIKPDVTTLPLDQTRPTAKSTHANIETSTEINLDDSQQLPRPIEPEKQLEATTLPPTIIQKPNLPDTNIFNVPADESSSETEVPVVASETPTPTSVEDLEPGAEHTTPSTSPQAASTDPIPVPTKSEEDSNSWDNIEHLLTTVPTTITANHVAGSAHHSQQKSSNSPQSESVFIRLSNRIKALERNMSLSGQYLEELSRRYKKQVEELQQTLTQQIQTVRTLEEENRRHHELEQLYLSRNTQLKEELDNLTLQIHACIVVIIFVGTFVFMVLMVAILFYRSLRRETKEMLSLCNTSSKRRNEANINIATTANTQRKIKRRKSFEDFSDHQQSIEEREQDGFSISSGYSDKFRRPSEAAMLILKDCKTDDINLHQQQPDETNQQHEHVAATTNLNNSSAMRQRKLSVCYGSNNNFNQTNNQSSRLPPQHPQKSQNKRRGEKHSWPNTAHAQSQARQHSEELTAADLIGDSVEISAASAGKPAALNTKSRRKKETQSLRRQQSSPAVNTDQPEVRDTKGGEFSERVLLDEDDLDNFIPNSDLAYNEFMPDGPRGYQCSNPTSNANNPASKKASNKQLDSNLKKSRRLSSPVFFKSPFTKGLKGKISNSHKTNPAHESTSWEWYRLKKSASPASSATAAAGGGGGDCGRVQTISSISNTTNNAFLHNSSPNASLDSSSLSEINFPTNSTENSFRILEEAILTSGENAIATAPSTASANCEKSSGGLSSSSNSNRSSSSNSSTQSKKKSRSFNKIFRKVF